MHRGRASRCSRVPLVAIRGQLVEKLIHGNKTVAQRSTAVPGVKSRSRRSAGKTRRPGRTLRHTGRGARVCARTAAEAHEHGAERVARHDDVLLNNSRRCNTP